MPRPEYRVVRSERDVGLYSPQGAKIVSAYRVFGRENPKYMCFDGLKLPDALENERQDVVFNWATKAHEKSVTTRLQRIKWCMEDAVNWLGKLPK